MEWSWKIRNLSFHSKIFEHCHLVHNSPLVPEKISQIQSDPSPLGYRVFSKDLGKYAIRQRATAFLFKKDFDRFSKKCSQILRAHFLFTPILFSHPYLTNSPPYLIPTMPWMVLENTQFDFIYICIKIIEFAISSTNLPIRICNPFLNRSRVPGLLKKYKKIISSKIVYYIMLRNSIFFSMFSLHISSHWVFTVNAETDSVWRWLC